MNKTLAVALLAGVLATLLLSQAVLIPSWGAGGTLGTTLITGVGQLWAEIAEVLRDARQAWSTREPPSGSPPSQPTAPPGPPSTTSSPGEPSQAPVTQQPPPDGFAWAHDPLTVAIEREAGVDARATTFVQAAVAEWQSLLRSRAQVPDTVPADQAPFGVRYVRGSEADIVFVLKQQMPGKALGETNVLYANGVLISARVEMAVSSAEGLPLDRADIQNIAAHEFGHAVGLGHNPNPEDLMYYEYQFVQVRRPIAPSSCDVDTVLAGYRTDGFSKPNDPVELSVFACA